ncbi:MAG: HesA/MoeB/ThiF family protein [Firmicutes bacterium]|nr:HesA/MoeB/ThiF family protein [Bacillota bacterium]
MNSEDHLRKIILDAAVEGTDPAGGSYLYLTLQSTGLIASENNLSNRVVELAALKADIIPDRYQRSIGTVGTKGQIKLLEAKVGVIGAGGLGGFALELLSRMGVGRLVVVDGDNFADSNLNRQLFGLETNLGKSKVRAAAERIIEVNSSVELETHHCLGTSSNLPEIFRGCDLVLDCLDNLPSRFDLEKVCGELEITMIHGAIAGFLGQIAVIRPDQPLLSAIYGNIAESGAKKGVETQLGNPAATPAMLASWQASEAVKYLAGLEGVLASNKLLIIDMQAGESYQVEVSP